MNGINWWEWIKFQTKMHRIMNFIKNSLLTLVVQGGTFNVFFGQEKRFGGMSTYMLQLRIRLTKRFIEINCLNHCFSHLIFYCFFKIFLSYNRSKLWSSDPWNFSWNDLKHDLLQHSIGSYEEMESVFFCKLKHVIRWFER